MKNLISVIINFHNGEKFFEDKNFNFFYCNSNIFFEKIKLLTLFFLQKILCRFF